MQTSAPLPTIDVIIPVWNRPDAIRTCLEAIEKQTYPRDRIKVYVVDNGSSDETPDVIRSFDWVHYLCEPKPGSYSARNTGIGQTSSQFVAFTDSDCIPEPDWLVEVVKAMLAHPDAGVVGGNIRLFASDVDTDPQVADYEQLFSLNQAKMTSGKGCMTANWISPRHVLEEHGGFNSSLKSTGDSDMANRIGATRAIVYADRAVVRHPVRGNRVEFLQKQRRVIGGRWQRNSHGRLAWARVLTIEAAARTKRILLAPIGMRRRMSLLVINVQVLATQLNELGNLLRGSEPARE